MDDAENEVEVSLPDHGNNNLIPEPINNFLEHNFDLSEFQARKGVYLMLMNDKKSDFLKHLQESYRLLDFWQFNETRPTASIRIRERVRPKFC